MKLHLNKHSIRLAACLAVIPVAACSGNSNQSSLEPAITSINPLTHSDLQFAAGTANIAGVVGLNTLVTLRQTGSQAGTSILTNGPVVTGPAGFVVPSAVDAYGDAGTDHISGFVPKSLTSPPPQTTFDPNAGGVSPAQGNYLASSYGFFPGIVANSGDTPDLNPGTLPFYSSENATLTAANTAVAGTGGPFQYIGGPPAFKPPGHTSTEDGTFESGYLGFTLGFVDFQAKPISGTYALNVVIPTGINAQTGVESYGTKSASSAVNAATILATWATAPTFVSDGTGGGTVTTHFAAGGPISEEYIEIEDLGVPYTGAGGAANAGYGCAGSGSPPYFYTFKVTPGAATVPVPDDIGPNLPGHAQGHTFCTAADNAGNVASANSGSTTPVVADTGDQVLVYGFAVDYPLFNSAFPQSDGIAAPVITTSGQDDVTTSIGTIAGE